MLVSYVNGFGQFGQAPTLPLLLQRARQRQAMHEGLGGSRRGFGAATGNWDAFYSGSVSSFQNDANDPVPGMPAKVVYCNRDNANRIQCQLQKYTGSAAAGGPVADMQRATDRLMNLIPAYNLGGREMKAPAPTGYGSSADTKFTIVDNGQNPIGSQSGYDGVNGPSTNGIVGQALVLAGALKQIPNSTALAFVSPNRVDISTEYAADIAKYLNGVADNFGSLLQAYQNRGNVPASTPLDVSTIPAVLPLVAQRSKIGPIIIGAAAMIGLTTIAALSAAKHKPDALYNDLGPALGRRRRHHRLRGW